MLPWKKEKDDKSVASLHNEVNRLFDDFLNFDVSPFRGSRLSGFSPSLDIKENEKEYLVTVELPGLDEKDIDVSVDNEVLTIKGEKKVENESKDDNYHLVERSYGSFSRSVRLGPNVNLDKIDASFKKGVLHVTLPKSDEAKKNLKKIAVKSS